MIGHVGLLKEHAARCFYKIRGGEFLTVAACIDHRKGGALREKALRELTAGHAVGHDHVGHEHIDLVLLPRPDAERRRSVLRLDNVVAGPFEDDMGEFADDGFIFNDKDGFRSGWLFFHGGCGLV